MSFWETLPETLFWIAFVAVIIFIMFIFELKWRVNGGFHRNDCRQIKTQLNGKTVIITGGNTGIGKETAIDLARRGARVIIGCRNAKKAEEGVKEIQRRSGSSNVVYRHLELSDQESVRKFADVVLKEEPNIYCLVNNAGIGKAAKGHRTKEGYNMVFAVNHFGPFLLTMLLLDRLKASSPSRIINVTSVAHTWIKTGEILVGSNEEAGAQTTVYCAIEESIKNLSGRYFDNCQLARETKLARDPALAKKLWEVSCQATGLDDSFS
ncbi:retinol dehydrogenase 11-like [Amphiura filiformis]|uniref:retinol dehydrogenase 11-like n=1 Tax=Amphiura filiformis TaxID=82378 RepID=UPI003B223905